MQVMIQLLRLTVLSGAILTVAATLLAIFKESPPQVSPVNQDVSLLASGGNTYLGPVTRVPGNPQLIRVEVIVKDSPAANGPQITRVEFYNKEIPLNPRDIYGNRGNASFQIPPGKYKLRWTVDVNQRVWPREVNHEEEVTVSPRDLWIQLEIEGDHAIIS